MLSETQKKVVDLLEDSKSAEVRRYAEFLQGQADAIKSEDLDNFSITSGMEGGGKSNDLLVSNFYLSAYLKKEISISKNWFFSGSEYLKALENIFIEMVGLTGLKLSEFVEADLSSVITSFDENALDKLKKKYRWTFYVLDEAQDLMHFDFMNAFNRRFTKIMMAIRELNLIFSLAYPDITMLNRYLRCFRVKTFKFCFPLPDGSRSLALYARRSYYRLILNPSKYIQMNSLLGDAFINKFAPDLIVMRMPRFPTDTPDYKEYLSLKRLSMARIVLKDSGSLLREAKKSPKNEPMDA